MCASTMLKREKAMKELKELKAVVTPCAQSSVQYPAINIIKQWRIPNALLCNTRVPNVMSDFRNENG